MNSNNRNRKENDEVEQLLQAAQEEILLKLSVNTHSAHRSSNSHNSDLDHRFQALKSRPHLPPSHSNPHPSPLLNVDDDEDDLKSVLGNDLSARFAALKASSSVSSSYKNHEASLGPKLSESDDEDEVEKIIRWAKDAARLNPSPPSDDDDDDDDDDDVHVDNSK